MRIAVLSSLSAWHFLDFQRAASPDHDVACYQFESLAATVGEKSTYNLNADCVFVRTMPAGSLQQIVFRMDLLQRLARSGVRVFNSPKSIEAAVDKYLSLALMSESEIPVPTTMVSQNLPTSLDYFQQLGNDVVVKPLFGSMGCGIKRLQTRSDAEEYFRENIEAGNVIYQQQFVRHGGFDIRLLVIGDRVLGMKRVNSESWITNISQGGIGEPHAPTEMETQLAVRAARAVGAHFAGVDLMYDTESGGPLIVEVNAVPGWRAISKVLDIDVAKMMVEEIENMVAED